ncbi:MAG TPA: nuclear transport factor 2 family protein [Novosphingobium sp.]|nr:nuclear transport factor 2 family protein [Novosphingobium sp.]
MAGVDTTLPAGVQITNLLALYAEHFDAGDFEATAALFDRGCVIVGSKVLTGRAAIMAMWRSVVRVYPGGRLHTRHLMTNPIITPGATADELACRSQWTVLQAAPGLALQVIATGRYHDIFRRAGSAWHFASRTYAGIDLAGDTTAHLLHPIAREEA